MAATFPTTNPSSNANGGLLAATMLAAGQSNFSTLPWQAQVETAITNLMTALPPGVSGGASVTAASPAATVTGVDPTITLDRAGGTIAGGGFSFYPLRGQVVVTATTTVKEAYLFGVRAGATISGVIDQTSATRVGALFAKIDVSAATLTAGQVSAAWFDWGSSATTPTSTECNVIRVQNTTAAVINSLIYGYGKSTFILDLSDNSQGTIVIGTAPTTLSGSIKVNANGNTRYIPLYTNPS